MLKGLKEKYLVRDDNDPEEVIAKRAGITATVEIRGIVRRGMTVVRSGAGCRSRSLTRPSSVKERPWCSGRKVD